VQDMEMIKQINYVYMNFFQRPKMKHEYIRLKDIIH